MIKCILKKIWYDLRLEKETIFALVIGLSIVIGVSVALQLYPVITSIVILGVVLLVGLAWVVDYLRGVVNYCDCISRDKH